MMLSTLIALSLQVMAGDCSFEPGAATGDIEVIAPARGTVILELRVAGQAPPPTALLHELEQRDIPATVLVSTSWAKRPGESLRGLDKKGHEVGYWLNLMSDLSLSSDLAVAPDLAHWVRSLRDGREVVEAATKADIRTIGVLRLPEVGEKAMEGLGFKAILPAERTVRDEPRRIASLHSAAGRARVLGEGPYADGWGAQLPAWTPASLDRATRVAARGGWVRIALPAAPAGAPLLARWLVSAAAAVRTVLRWLLVCLALAGPVLALGPTVVPDMLRCWMLLGDFALTLAVSTRQAMASTAGLGAGHAVAGVVAAAGAAAATHVVRGRIQKKKSRKDSRAKAA